MNLRILIAAFLFCATITASAAPPDKDPGHKTMTEALLALRHANNDEQKDMIRNELYHLPLESPDQILTIYDESIGMEKRVKSGEGDEMYAGMGGALARILGGASDPKFADALAEAMDRESRYKPRDFDAFMNGDMVATIHADMRMKRVQALADILVKTKNRKALPALRRMVDLPMVGEIAVEAIGKIGDPQDLADFIARIKKDPKSRINVSSFGPAAFDRIIKEIDDPSANEDAKYTFVSSLQYMMDSSNKARFIGLLGRPDRAIVKAAATALCSSATPEDSDMLIHMLETPNLSVRHMVAQTMDRIWSDQFVSPLRYMLLGDPLESNRAEAAEVLGNHKAVDAAPDLEKAQHDREEMVRRYATEALNKLK